MKAAWMIPDGMRQSDVQVAYHCKAKIEIHNINFIKTSSVTIMILYHRLDVEKPWFFLN
jgi:hypothetical protein